MKFLYLNVVLSKLKFFNSLFFVFFLIAGNTFADTYPPISHLGIENGLSNNIVRCVCQDHNGFMWFGTYDGLNRYDGYNFKIFRNKQKDSNSLVHNFIYAITEDFNHKLWIGTRQGANRYDDLLGKFTPVSYRKGLNKPVQKLMSVVRDIKADKKNNIFIGTEGLGLLICRDGSSNAEQIPLVQPNRDTFSYGIQAIKIDKVERVWVLVQNRGLYFLDRTSMKLRLISPFVDIPISLETDGNHIWIGTHNAVYEYSIVDKTILKILDESNEKLITGSVMTLKLDKDKNLWIGTDTGDVGIWNIMSRKMEFLRSEGNKYSLSTSAIYAIYEDKQSRKWICTARGGITIVDPQKNKFQNITNEHGNVNSLTYNVVSAFCETPDGNIWIGTDGGGLNIWNRKNNKFTLYKHSLGDPTSLCDNFITSIKSDRKQNVWIGTFNKGISRFDWLKHRFVHYDCINSVSGVVNNVVYALLIDRNQQLWASTLRQGSLYGALYRFNYAANRFELFDTNLSDLFSLNEDNNGVLWGGNLNQLIKIDRVNRKHQFYPIGFVVRAAYEDRHNNFWIGTEGGGLLLFDRKKNNIIERYTTEEGLCNNGVLSIQDDLKGNLWISTYNGLSKFNIAKRKFDNYYQSDGILSNQFNYNAALTLQSGEMLFGGIKGISFFHPEDIKEDKSMPHLLLTGIDIDNVPLEQNERFIDKVSVNNIETIKVPFNHAVFSFNFTALEYSSPNKISYSYFMEGWDKSWTKPTGLRTGSYTHLNEGSYIFRVKCTNAEGQWNPQEIALNIIVLPPWYRSKVAYMIYLITFLGILYLFFQYKFRQNRLMYDIKIAHLNSLKEKEINEKRISFFTNVSHEFRTPLTLIINPVKEMLTGEYKEADPEQLTTVYRNARRLLSLVDQLLLFRKADSDSDDLKLVQLNFTALCNEVYLYFVQQARQKKIDYRFECINEAIEMFVDQEKMEIVFFNLLSNAFKYTPKGGKIIFHVEEITDKVQVSISDTGCGIPEYVGGKLFEKFNQVKGNNHLSKGGFGIGLYLVKLFIDRHKGALSYKSKEGEGTTFKFTLLKGKDHFHDEVIYPNDNEESIFLQELANENSTPINENNVQLNESINIKWKNVLPDLVSEQKTILVIDDDDELRKYISQVFNEDFTVIEAEDGNEGAKLARHYLPDVIISDISMQGMNGIELCTLIKEDPSLSHIPVILLTAHTSTDYKLKGIESGADDYITKPFEKKILKAKVLGILKKRNTLQQYFYNEITLKKNDLKISIEYKEFLNRCIQIVESHLDDDNFYIKTLAAEIGMSHSQLYKKVKSVSGQSIKEFIRFIRLRKAAEIMINTEHNITEITFMVGFNDIKYFREHFFNLFGMNPSEYIKKYRKPFHNTHHINKREKGK